MISNKVEICGGNVYCHQLIAIHHFQLTRDLVTKQNIY